ncbi:hypothetical protein C8Q80DRAFT_1271988 [Daedaleopsis nitida]|nr:hypothetical protein C8Q80DRAFT_1271988 [Daedaleopsis nitida]
MLAPNFVVLATLVSAACMVHARPLDVVDGVVDTVRHRPYPSNPPYHPNPSYPAYPAYPRQVAEITSSSPEVPVGTTQSSMLSISQKISSSIPAVATPGPDSLAVPTTSILPASLVTATRSIPTLSSETPTTSTMSPTLPTVSMTGISRTTATITATNNLSVASPAVPPAGTVHVASAPTDTTIASSIPTPAIAVPSTISTGPGVSQEAPVSARTPDLPSTPAGPATQSVDIPTLSAPTPVVTPPPSHVGTGVVVTTTTTSYEPQPTSDEPEPSDDAPSYGDDPYEDGGWTPDSSNSEEPSEGDQDSRSDESPADEDKEQ